MKKKTNKKISSYFSALGKKSWAVRRKKLLKVADKSKYVEKYGKENKN